MGDDEREFGPQGELESRIGDPPITLVPRHRALRSIEKKVGGNLVQWMRSLGQDMPSLSLVVDIVHALKDPEDQRTEDQVGDAILASGLEPAFEDLCHAFSRIARGGRDIRTVDELHAKMGREREAERKRQVDRILATIREIRERGGDELPAKVTEFLDSFLRDAGEPKVPLGNGQGEA